MSARDIRTRGILFKPDLHQSILAGRKTETRRLDLGWAKLRKGDRLYVKEMLMRQDAEAHDSWAEYHLGGAYVEPSPFKWRWSRSWLSPLHMPRECARTWLELVEDGRVERLQDITDEGAIAEGVRPLSKEWQRGEQAVVKYAFMDQGDMSSVPWTAMPRSAREAFRNRWDEVHPGSWDAHPEVAVLRFRLVTP